MGGRRVERILVLLQYCAAILQGEWKPNSTLQSLGQARVKNVRRLFHFFALILPFSGAAGEAKAGKQITFCAYLIYVCWDQQNHAKKKGKEK